MDRSEDAQRGEVREHCRTPVAQERGDDAGQRRHAHHARRHDQHRQDQEQRQCRGEKESVVALRHPGDAEAAPHHHRKQERDGGQARGAGFLADRCQDQVGVAGRQVARVAQTQPGAERAAGCHPPHRVGDLIAARGGVVPRRQPHADPFAERRRDVQAVSEIEAGGQEQQPDDRHPHPASGDRVHRQEHAAEEQRRAEVFLKEEEQQRGNHADDDRSDVVDTRQIDPGRQVQTSHGLPPHFAQQLPAAREIAGEEHRQEEPNRFDRLQRSQVDLGGAAAGTVAEQDEQDRQ
jgi:hypothetical protein